MRIYAYGDRRHAASALRHKAALCPPERRDVLQEVTRKMRTRRAIILLGVAMALLFLASSLLSTEPSAQTTSPEGKIVYQMQDT